MHDTRARREVPRPSDDAVVETHAHANDQVGVLHGEVGLDGAVHAHHAERLRVLLGKDTQPKEGRSDGNAAGFSQAHELIGGAGHGHAVARDQDRPLGRVQHRRGLAESEVSRGIELGFEFGWGEVGERLTELDHGQLNVLREIDQDRAGTAFGGQAKRLGKHGRDVFGRLELECALGDRTDHAEHVHFLERLRADRGAGDLARQGDHGHTVHVGRCESGQQIGGARTAGRHTHADATCSPRVAVGRVGGVLFVADEDVAQAGVAGQFSVKRQGGAARVTKEGRRTGSEQCLAGQGTAGQGSGAVCLLRCSSWGCE